MVVNSATAMTLTIAELLIMLTASPVSGGNMNRTDCGMTINL